MDDITKKWPKWLAPILIIFCFIASIFLALFAADSESQKKVKGLLKKLRGKSEKEESEEAPLD